MTTEGVTVALVCAFPEMNLKIQFNENYNMIVNENQIPY
jgi:hypothetical protein